MKTATLQSGERSGDVRVGKGGENRMKETFENCLDARKEKGQFSRKALPKLCVRLRVKVCVNGPFLGVFLAVFSTTFCRSCADRSTAKLRVIVRVICVSGIVVESG